MATITKPMALDETFNTTETTPRSQADVLAAIENAIRQGFGRSAADVSYDNTSSGLTADDVQEAVDELAAEKVDKVEGKGLSSNDFTDEDKEALDNMELNIASTQTASGNPLTLTDCAPINAESLKVELEPQQDLHGQSAPYVGGAGKNKLPMTVEGIKAANTDGTWSGNVYTISDVTFTILTDIDGNVTGIKANGTASANVYFAIGNGTLNSDIILNGCPEGGQQQSRYAINLYSSVTSDNFYDDGNGVSISSQSASVFKVYIIVRNGYNAQNLLFQPMIRLSTETDPTFAPYSNICPITGYTECEVDDVGKNLFGGEYNQFFPLHFSSEVRIIASANPPSGGGIPQIAYYDENKIQIDYWTMFQESSSVNNRIARSFIYPTTAYYVKFITYETTDYQIEVSPTNTPYEPYRSSNATIQFGQTVYGGRSNLTDGGTDDEFESVDLGTLSWEYRGNGVFSATLADYLYKDNVSALCTGYKYLGTVSGASLVTQNGSVYLYYNESQSSKIIYIKDNQFTDATTFAGKVSGIIFVYEKATPTTIQTPPTDLKLLKGTNNITTNGTTINLGYQPDNVIGEVKGEIEKCAVDAEFMQFTDGTDTFTDVNLSLDASLHTVSVVGAKIEQKRFMCFEVMDKMGGVLQGILASCIAFTDGAKTPSGTAFRAYIESLQMYVNFRIYGSGDSYTLAYQSETSFSASAFYLRVRMMNNL